MLEKWIQTLQAGDCLAERDLKKLCLMVREHRKASSVLSWRNFCIYSSLYQVPGIKQYLVPGI